MQPILTSAQMRDADARAVATRGVDALVAAAGTAVGLAARSLLGSCYGRRVLVVVGPGLNGADGRVAAHWLSGRGARVDVVRVADQPFATTAYDLYVDAAFGLGCSRAYVAPRVAPETRVLAVDLPSGVDADSGELLGSPARADVTVALGALKPAHVTGAASLLVGAVRLAGLGIVEEFVDALVEDADLAALVSVGRDDHKWSHAVQVFAGSGLMPGAAELCVRGALAGGASMVRLATRGDVVTLAHLPPEVVRSDDPVADPRCRAVVAGPGLGADAPAWLATRLDATTPTVLDADGLHRDLVDAGAPWILTPHDGEYARLAGHAVPTQRLEAARALARDLGVTVLLKGPTTVVASPAGPLRVVRSGTPALATAGSGDVLAGLIGATLARGHDPLSAGALCAHLHGRAGADLDTYALASDVALSARDLLFRLASIGAALA
ncbi:MAG: NAD(P)H-hydrate dehydratase [Acidimicrobiales bacterium]